MLLLIVNKSFAAQWHHIENLDLFFQRISFYMGVYSLTVELCFIASAPSNKFAVFLNVHHVYNLHQKNGFTCMLLGEIFELVYVSHPSEIMFLRDSCVCTRFIYGRA